MYVLHIHVSFCVNSKMGRPKIESVVEGIITYPLKKKTSYRHIQRELKGQRHNISRHLIGKTRGTGYKKAKIGPYKRTHQKSTPGVIRKVAIVIKRFNPHTQREMATQLGVSQSTIHRIIKNTLQEKLQKKCKVHKLNAAQIEKNYVNVHGSFINV